jgi:hypothetical protein
VHVALISQLVVPLITAAAAEDKAGQLLTLEVCDALLRTAFRPQDTVLFGECLPVA